MNAENMKIKSLGTADLIKVATLHRRAFAESALTRLGMEPTRRYYAWLLNGPHDSISIGVFNSGDELYGFCFAGVYKGALSGFLRKNRRFLVLWLLLHPWMMFNSLIFDRVKIAFNSLRKKSGSPTKPKPIENKSYGVLSIATDPEHQGLGIGKMLMKEVEKQALSESYNQLHLTVHPSNTSAVLFYEKCGWVKSLQDEDEWQGRMTKAL